MLRQDVKAGYLPRPTNESRGGTRDGRVWSAWEVNRARQLYGLRQKRFEGKFLKVALFLYDGWGWEQVKPLCLAGLGKAIAVESSTIRRHLKQPCPENVQFIMEDVEPELGVRRETVLLTWGLGLFGKPIEGGTLQQLFRAVHWFAVGGEPNKSDEQDMVLAEECMAQSGLTWDALVSAVEHANTEQVETARRTLREQCRTFRRWSRGYENREEGEKKSANSLNGLSQQELTELFRKLPQRFTPAQFLAATMGLFLYIQTIPWLPLLLFLWDATSTLRLQSESMQS